jgi:putative transposase
MKYRRTTATGCTYFFTVNLAERNKTLLVDHIDVLRNSINQVKRQHPFKLGAMVVLPDHLHAMLTLPEDDKNYPTRWRLIKAGLSREISKLERITNYELRITNGRSRKGGRGIWQRRYWEHLILGDNDYENHVDYIHFNPLKLGYVTQATDWLFSTIHDFIKRGLLSPSWGHDGDDVGINFGERG